MKLLITGAAGRIGRALTTGLGDRHTLLLSDLHPPQDGGAHRWIALDVTDADAVRDAVRDMDAVVHLAGHPNSRDWDLISALNIGGTRHVLTAAAEAGVPRIVLASSVHACGMFPADAQLTADMPQWPDSPYGVSKAVGETMARYIADNDGLTAVALRICSFRPEPSNARELATWISPADMVRLTEAALTADITGFRTVWGISNNMRARVDRAHWAAIGYHPCDDAEHHADRLQSAGVAVDRVSEWDHLGGSMVRPLNNSVFHTYKY